MAKPTTVKIRLNSEGNTGFFYVEIGRAHV